MELITLEELNKCYGRNPVPSILISMLGEVTLEVRNSGRFVNDYTILPMPTIVWEDVRQKVNEHVQSTCKLSQYVPQRQAAYPTLQDQLDMLYWDKKYNTNKWMETIDNVKRTFPKPV